MDELMGRNEYARHRGCAPNAVTKAEDDGRIAAAVVRDESGAFVGIKWRLADQLWAVNTDPGEAAKSGASTIAKGTAVATDATLNLTPPQGEKADTAPPPSSDPHGFYEARARTEIFKAKQAELDYLEAVGLLVSSKDVEKEIAEIFGTLKNNVLRIADRKAQILAAETDPIRVHRLLSDEFRMVFDECSRRLASNAPGGPEEREGALP
jgi:hypothetical protein